MKLGPCKIELERSAQGTKLVLEGLAALAVIAVVTFGLVAYVLFPSMF